MASSLSSLLPSLLPSGSIFVPASPSSSESEPDIKSSGGTKRSRTEEEGGGGSGSGSNTSDGTSVDEEKKKPASIPSLPRLEGESTVDYARRIADVLMLGSVKRPRITTTQQNEQVVPKLSIHGAYSLAKKRLTVRYTGVHEALKLVRFVEIIQYTPPLGSSWTMVVPVSHDPAKIPLNIMMLCDNVTWTDANPDDDIFMSLLDVNRQRLPVRQWQIRQSSLITVQYLLPAPENRVLASCYRDDVTINLDPANGTNVVANPF